VERTVEDLKAYIREIPDFPKPGIIFKDITPLLADGQAFHAVVDAIADPYRGRIDVVLGIESRGFIVGAAVAYALQAGLAVVRKPGKLPAQTFAAQYVLEYGNDALEIHRDAFGHPCRVLIVDDLLATGGTARAAVQLVKRLDGEVVACAFVIELAVLNGRDRLQTHPVFSLVQYAE
jgi:adenine phosphoribosyltransferase